MIKAMGKDENLYAMALRALFDGRNSVSISDSMIYAIPSRVIW